MFIFSTNKQKYLSQELLSWIKSIVFISLILLLFYLSGKLNTDKALMLCTIAALGKLADTFIQYRVIKIQIDKSGNKVDLLLKSQMSGTKSKSYDLNKIHAQIIKQTGFKRLILDHIALQISLPQNQRFHITQRYGFTEQNLTEIAKTINQQQAK